MVAVPSNEDWVRACLVNFLTDHPEPRQIMPARCWELDTVPEVFVPRVSVTQTLVPSTGFLLLYV